MFIPVLTEEHELVRRAIMEFVEKYVRPNARRIDGGWYPREILEGLGKLGLLAPTAPPEYGGAGADHKTFTVVIEELAKASPDVASIAEIHGSMSVYLLAKYAKKELKERVLPDAVAGRKIISFAMTEPCCGSDAAAIQTSAKREGGEWVLSGTKIFISMGMFADGFLILARSGPQEARHRAITAFFVERGPCVETTPITPLGLHGTGTAEVKLDGCRVGDEAVIGEVNKGFYEAMEAVNFGRHAVGAIGLGIAEEAFSQAFDYAFKRTAYGRPLKDLQIVRHGLAELYTNITATAYVVYNAAHAVDAGKWDEFVMLSQMAKVMGSRLAVEASRAAMQIMGGYGHTTDVDLEMLYRDAKIYEVYEGANEVAVERIFSLLERAKP